MDSSLKVTNMPSLATLDETITHKNILIERGELSVFQTIVTSEQLPQERYFRDAWRFVNGGIAFDLPACRERHLNKLRRVRNSKLQDSDPDYMRALEQGDTVKLNALKTYRQALRDMPQTTAAEFQAASTPNAIRSIQPAILTTPKP